jgi:uncharacterized protein YbjT (DUF2867 family)
MSNHSESQVRLVIVGASGMVGGYALRYMLDHPGIARVTSIGRRKLGISHPKLNEVLHQDFSDTGTVPNVELRRITVDFTIEFARVLRASSPDAAFAFLSGAGADSTGRSRMAFARYKGEAEKALLAAGFPRVCIFRPAYIYPVEPRKEPNFSYRLLRVIYPVFRMLFPNQAIRADDLARSMVNVAIQKTKERESLVFENRDIRAIAQLA